MVSNSPDDHTATVVFLCADLPSDPTRVPPWLSVSLTLESPTHPWTVFVLDGLAERAISRQQAPATACGTIGDRVAYLAELGFKYPIPACNLRFHQILNTLERL
jgi:hypothetical protein